MPTPISRFNRYFAVLFTDVERSVGILEDHGEAFAERVRQFVLELTLKACAKNSQSFQYLKSTGDGALIIFENPHEAVLAGLELLEVTHGVLDINSHRIGIRIRIGVDAGYVMCEGNGGIKDVHGRYVNRSARIMNLADGGRLFTSTEVREKWLDRPEPTARWRCLGAQKLKGFRDPIVVWEVYDESKISPAGMIVDALRQGSYAEVPISRLSKEAFVALVPALAFFVLAGSSYVPPLFSIAALIILFLLFEGWQQYRRIRDAEDRGELLAALLFVSLTVVLSSPLLVTAYTHMDPYGLFLLFNNDKIMAAIGTNLFVNVLLGYSVSILFLKLYYHCLFKHFNSIGKSTFIPVTPSFLLAYIVVALISQKGAEIYFLIAFFPMTIAFLGMVGYSHPLNKTDLFTARALVVLCIVMIVVGFILAIAGLLFYLAFLVPQAPEDFETLLWSTKIDWSSSAFRAGDWGQRFKAGFIWMVLSSSMFLILCLGAPTTLLIYHFQYLPNLAEERIRGNRGRP